MTHPTSHYTPPPLTESRWMPGLTGVPRQHWVLAGTPEIPDLAWLYQQAFPTTYRPGDEHDHYRAICRAVCLRMSTGIWEEWERCDICQETAPTPDT